MERTRMKDEKSKSIRETVSAPKAEEVVSCRKIHAELVILARGKVLMFEPNTREEKMECGYYVVVYFVNLIFTEIRTI